jgi:hypothetical protein
VEACATCEESKVAEVALLKPADKPVAVMALEVGLVAEDKLLLVVAVGEDKLLLVAALGTLLLLDIGVALELDVGALVALIVFARFGKAFGLPLHIPYAIERTLRALLTPWQGPETGQDIIHCSAPSPIVNPDVLWCEHRQSRDGVVEQAVSGKLDWAKERRHGCAHGGTKFDTSFGKEDIPEEDCAATRLVVRNAKI